MQFLTSNNGRKIMSYPFLPGTTFVQPIAARNTDGLLLSELTIQELVDRKHGTRDTVERRAINEELRRRPGIRVASE